MVILHFREIRMKASVEKRVICEKCGHCFAYLLTRKYAMATLPGLERPAEETSRERLALRLKDVEVVSCPGCGWIQSHMAVELGRRFLSPLRKVGRFFLFSGVGFTIFLLVMGIFFPHDPRDRGSLDMDWFGAALACGGT